MSDDFGTVNVRRGERGKEIEAVRQQYRHHRDALVRMVADAPTEHLAAEYQRLIREIDNSIAKLDEIEGRPASASPPASTSAGTRPLVTTPEDERDTLVTDNIPPATDEPSRQSSRVLMIVIAGVIVLAAIVWLLWRASGDRNKVVEQPVTVTTPVVETTATNAPPAATTTVAPAATTAVLRITPLAANYGTIRKGTRAVRQFSIENTSAAAVPVKAARSTCRCLFYDYAQNVPAHGKETITVTIDGARAKAGALRETVVVTSKNDPAVTAQFDVSATIQ
ncbi:MAG TPA: DUF1573 domain-containing protein [Thermoanaerobaculia bacterium]|nr:DUF1573 domain-containing protein [Thermoanaerobaculia bacterium]